MEAIAVTLVGLFGPVLVKGVDKAIENFDWSNFSVKDSKSNDYLHIGIAPSYGQLTAESIKQLDDKLKIIISGTVKALGKVDPSQRTADNIEGVMMNNPLLEPDGNKVERADKIIKDGVNFFKFDGSPDRSVVEEVQTWFTNLVKDRDVLMSTKIDMKVMSDIVAQSGATITNFFNFWVKTEKHSQTVLDVGVLRFPDIDNPYFKLYRIKLTAWSDCTRIVFGQKDKNGITGEYYARKFKPRESVIRELKADSKKKAIKEAEDLFK